VLPIVMFLLFGRKNWKSNFILIKKAVECRLTLRSTALFI
jgi:hypothetical protein